MIGVFLNWIPLENLDADIIFEAYLVNRACVNDVSKCRKALSIKLLLKA